MILWGYGYEDRENENRIELEMIGRVSNKVKIIMNNSFVINND